MTESQLVMVLIEANYTTDGKKDPEIKAYSANLTTHSIKDSFYVKLVELLKFQVLAEKASSAVSEMWTRNNNPNRTISWRLNTGNGIIDSNQSIALNQSQTVMIFIENNYTLSYVFLMNASVNSSQYTDNEQGIAIIP